MNAEEVQQRRKIHGTNTLPKRKSRSGFAIFLHQFRSPLIYLLMVAALLAFLLQERSDAFVILAVLLINAFIGTFQEGKAERSMEALRQLSALKVRVWREGKEEGVEAAELVPGDLLLLSAGDAVGADARLFEAANLEVAEAALTGESFPVSKHTAALAAELPLGDRKNMVYAGTHVTAGRGRAVVVTTGLKTEVGKIATLTQAAEEPKTPLERRIAQFGRYIVLAASVMFFLVLAIGYLRGLRFTEIFMVALSQMVSMVPEGLPVAMTVALAVGMQRMAKRGAIVRQLSAVETLGSTNVICSDKTGTLTKNEMTVTRILLPGERWIEVTGSGYDPEGRFLESSQEISPERDRALMAMLRAGALCNDAELVRPSEEIPRWQALGDPTEAALLTAALKAGLPREALKEEFPRKEELPFNSDLKMMATLHHGRQDRHIFIKGAPEVVLEFCGFFLEDSKMVPLDAAQRRKLHDAGEKMAQEALRLLAYAEIRGKDLDLSGGFAALKGKAAFLGLTGQLDPPRLEAGLAVRECREAGIRPVMVTGDHKMTGLAVAKMLGIAEENDLALSGTELEAISDEELQNRIERISVFARVHPEQKLRIVEAWQARNAVVAMTGDGVNDAPALAKADVGVAMGIAGTEVAKNAAKIVVTDDNFATIVKAVEEGRLVYRNIKKLILYLVSTAASEIVVLMLALVFGLPLPLVAVQILWINLVTDGMMTIPLIMTPPEGDEMSQPPVPRGEAVLTRPMLRRMALMTSTIAFSTFGYFLWRLHLEVPLAQVRTEAFTVLAVCQWFNAINSLSATQSAFRRDTIKDYWLIGGLLLGNLFHAAIVFMPPLQKIFHTTSMPLQEAVYIGLIASLVLWAEEIRKFLFRRKNRNSARRAAVPSLKA